MAFVIKNPSRQLGEAKINGEWVVVSPGKSVSSGNKPSSLSSNLKVFVVREITSSASEKDVGKKGSKPNKNSNNGSPPTE